LSIFGDDLDWRILGHAPRPTRIGIHLGPGQDAITPVQCHIAKSLIDIHLRVRVGSNEDEGLR
jgi:hypothetical protein